MRKISLVGFAVLSMVTISCSKKPPSPAAKLISAAKPAPAPADLAAGDVKKDPTPEDKVADAADPDTLGDKEMGDASSSASAVEGTWRQNNCESTSGEITFDTGEKSQVGTKHQVLVFKGTQAKIIDVYFLDEACSTKIGEVVKDGAFSESSGVITYTFVDSQENSTNEVVYYTKTSSTLTVGSLIYNKE